MTPIRDPSSAMALSNGTWRSPAPLENLQRRAAVQQQIRQFFNQREFLEVDTPLLSRDTVVDRHIEPFRVQVFADPCRPDEGETWFLQTSPEFHMKRLISSGAHAIYQFAHAFRAGEIGNLHQLEFTMLEWYRTGDDLCSGMDLLDEFMQFIADLRPARRITYRQVFLDYVGIDPFTASVPELQRVVKVAGGVDSNQRDDLLDWLLAECITPRLGHTEPVLVYDFPASQAALAEIRDGRPPVAERFELFWRGIELANGYHELRSAEELLARFEAINQLRAQDGRQPLPVHSNLLEAMRSGLPPCAGVALGFERLLMILLAESSVARVSSFSSQTA